MTIWRLLHNCKDDFFHILNDYKRKKIRPQKLQTCVARSLKTLVFGVYVSDKIKILNQDFEFAFARPIFVHWRITNYNQLILYPEDRDTQHVEVDLNKKSGSGQKF